MAVLYRHIRLDKNEPFYIGIGADVKRAYSKHGRSKYWGRVAKLGYEVDILMEDLSWEKACEKEVEFIALYGRADLGQGPLVNMTNGGDGALGRPQTQRLKEKLKSSPNRFSLAKWQKENGGSPNKGKKMPSPTEETLVKRSISLKKAWETRSRLEMSEHTRNLWLNNGYREKLSTYMIKNNPTYTKKECEHCGKIVGLGGYTRWHSDNCKNKNKTNIK